jgi:nicotinamidase-related amidase
MRALKKELVLDAGTAARLILDVQKAIDAAYAAAGARNNPRAESNIAHLLAVWRSRQRPIIHVRHDSTDAYSAYRPGQSGNEFKVEVAPQPGERIVAKRSNSAFIGTDLERLLRDAGLKPLVVSGVSTNKSVEATVRMAGNLGFRTYLVEDACFTFARRDFSGRLRTADEVHAMSLANLHEEYCTVINTAALLAN